MKLLEVLEICKNRGKPMTPANLYKAGKKYNFIIDSEDREKYCNYEFDEIKFNEWLDKLTEKAPEGWISIKDLAEKLNCSLKNAYLLAEDTEIIRVGIRGVKYVEYSRIEEVIEQRLQRHKEKIYGKR